MFADYTRVRIGDERQVENSSYNNSQVSQGGLKGILKIFFPSEIIKCVGCRKESTRGNLSAQGRVRTEGLTAVPASSWDATESSRDLRSRRKNETNKKQQLETKQQMNRPTPGPLKKSPSGKGGSQRH